MIFTKTDDDYFEVMSEMINQSNKIYIIIQFDLSNTKKIIKDLKKEGLHTYKKRDYEKKLYEIQDTKKNVYFKEKIGRKTRYFEQQDFKSSIPGISYSLIEDMKKIDHKEKLLKKQHIVSHEFIFNHPETPHTFTIYEGKDIAELKLSSPPQITPEKIKYDILSFYNFLKLKKAETNIGYFYKFLENPSHYLRGHRREWDEDDDELDFSQDFEIPFLPIFTKLVKDNLVAYDIITTFIDIDDFIDVLYNHKNISNKDDYKSKVNHDLSEKLNGMKEIDGMTPEKINICHEKLKEIVDTILI